MSRRKCTGDQEFGSDSFLDIIANIVGILIILIVIAGIKVARQPPPGGEAVVEAADVLSASSLDASTPLQPQANDASMAFPFEIPGDGESADLHSAIAVLSEPPPPDETKELDREIQALTLQVDDAVSTTASSEEELQELLQRVQANNTALKSQQDDAIVAERSRARNSMLTIKTELDDVKNKQALFETTIAKVNRRQRYIAEALKLVSLETRRLREVIEEAESVEPTGDRLNHRLSPVGRAVTDAEEHFRLSGGRIAHIPLNGLLDRMKSQVGARRNVVMRFHRYEGVVGPVGGFNMQYTVQRESMAPMQALQYGGDAYRISIARWTIQPADTLAAEPVDTALRLGSRFRQIIESADPDTTVTIWLYPEDFRYFGRLREIAHALNLRVAARPLPVGTPIAGSPNGSRSSSQ